MKRFFGKGGKQNREENVEPKDKDVTVVSSEEQKPEKKESQEEVPLQKKRSDDGDEDIDLGRRGRRPDVKDQSKHSKRADRHNANDVEDDESEYYKKSKSSPPPDRDDSSRLLTASKAKNIKAFSEPESDSDDDKEDVTDSKVKESKRKGGKKEKVKGLVEKGHSSTSLINDSKEEFSHFLTKGELGNLTKIEPGKGGFFLSSTYKYKKSINRFRIRARILKYPSFSDQDTWPGDLAVVDERIFSWQEKVFSGNEARKYQKLDNCITEQEKEYHKNMLDNPDSVGKFLYSYVSDDPYVLKKKEKYLVRRCPVPHIRKGKNGLQFLIDGKSANSDGDSLELDAGSMGGEHSGDESIDFDEPISSSTPKTKRKEDKAKNERKEIQKKEKELRDLEKKNKRLQETNKKMEKIEEKKKIQEEAKVAEDIKKIREQEANEKDRKEGYIKKYQYSKRPSLPLGARLRSIQLSPSPHKLSKKQKSLVLSRSSEFSTDYQEEEEKVSELRRDRKRSTSDSLKVPQESSSEKAISSRRVGHENSDAQLISSKSTKIETKSMSRNGRKFYDRFSYKNSETMYIMASVPYLPGRSREVVVCMIRNLPQQGILVFKPALGYRNIEVKRNHVYRISSEPYFPEGETFKEDNYSIKNFMKQSSKAPDDFVGMFELAPKNELRLTVLGEITTVEGFDLSPLCVYYIVDIPKGWRNDSVMSNIEGITHTCYTTHNNVAHFSHEFSFHLAFSMDSVEEGNSYPSPVIAFMVVSVAHPSPRIMHEGYGYISIPMTPGCHYVKVRTWKPRPRSTVEKMRATFLHITPSLQNMKSAHIPHSEYEDSRKANLVGFQTEPSGTVKFRLHVIHQTPSLFKTHEKKLDLLEKMSSATILKSVQAVIEAFQRAREKASTLKDQYNVIQ